MARTKSKFRCTGEKVIIRSVLPLLVALMQDTVDDKTISERVTGEIKNWPAHLARQVTRTPGMGDAIDCHRTKTYHRAILISDLMKAASSTRRAVCDCQGDLRAAWFHESV